MKKLFLALLPFLFLISCTQQEDVSDIDLSSESTQTSIRSINEAVSIAKSLKSQSVVGRSSSIKEIDVCKVHTIMSDISRSSKTDTILYAVDFEDGGFALIAAPTDFEPIIALIDDGSYSDVSNESVAPYQEFLQNVKSVISNGQNAVRDDPINPILPITPNDIFKYDTIEYHEFQIPAVKVAWDQRWPSNIYAPNGIAGCGPLAIAQLFSALEAPSYITYTFPEKDVNSEYLDWNAIKSHIKSETGYVDDCVECFASAENHKTIGRICREIGKRSFASYDDNSTGTYYENYESVIRDLTAINSDKAFYDLDALYEHLRSVKGVGLSVSYDLNSYGGHAWLIDAAGRVGCEINEYEYLTSIKDYQFSMTVQQATKILHHNWGWGGVCNGWINILYLDPNLCISHDYVGENNSKPYNFDTNNFKCLFYNL